MTPAEFARGWKLLVIQPWGWRYNQLDQQGKPTVEAQTQLEFYYEKLKWADPQAWWQVAELYAQGKEWPSVTDLKAALQQVNARFVPVLRDQRPGEPMPSEVRDALRRLGVKLEGG